MQHEASSVIAPAARKGFFADLLALLWGDMDADDARSLQYTLLAFGS